MLNKRSSFSLCLISAGILSITAQSFLLVPARQAALTQSLPPVLVIVLAGLYYLVSLQCLASVLLSYTEKQRLLTHLFIVLTLGTLCILYARARLMVELLLLIGLASGHLLIVLEPKLTSQTPRDFLAGYTLVVNTIAGIGLLLLQGVPFASYSPLLPWRIPLSLAFLLTAGMGGYTLFTNFVLLRRLCHVFGALPWLVWGLIFTTTFSLPNIIPALLLTAVLLVSDAIAWSKLILPGNDVLGHRLFRNMGWATFSMLFFLAILLQLGEQTDALAPLMSPPAMLHARDFMFLLSLGITALASYGVISANVTINGLMSHLADAETSSTEDEAPQEFAPQKLSALIAKIVEPFSASHQSLRSKVKRQEEQLLALNNRLLAEKRRAAQHALLIELGQHLESQLDPPVAAQLAANTIQRAFDCVLVTIFTYESERGEFVSLATAGTMMRTVPPEYRQTIQSGLIGRAARLRKTQVASDTRLDPDYFGLEKQSFLSEVVVPLIYHGHLKGSLVVDDEKSHAFSNSDVATIEAMAIELMRAWEQSGYHQRLTELIQAGISLSTLFEPQAAIREIATIAKQTLEARFTFVALLDQEGNFTRTSHAGYAPALLKSLNKNPAGDTLMQAALNASQPFRVRDARKYNKASHLEIEHTGLRCLLAVPIRLHRLSIGAILAFGKQGELFFTENDESLARLLSSQAAAAIESAWLYQELRTTLSTTTLLYQLSFNVIQAKQLGEAAKSIVETAQKLADASRAGIVLFTADKQVRAEVEIDRDGFHEVTQHPKDLIEQTLQTGQSIIVSGDHDAAKICYPLQTPLEKYGVLWLDIPESRPFYSRHSANLQTLANQAAIALERVILMAESRKQAEEIKAAYQELETVYDQTLAALMSALDARDRETEGHSIRVGKIAHRLGEELGLTPQQLKALERGALLHDIGKIGISDTILHKPGPLSPDEWEAMRLHPDIGARIVEDIPFLKDTLPVIRYHQERWDGSGYPIGSSNTDIPLLARIFAVADAFDALTSIRPYRSRVSDEKALAYLQEQAGVLFDPAIVAVLEKLFAEGRVGDLLAPA